VASAVARSGHPELADVLRAHGERLTDLCAAQRRVVTAITRCRTAALGGHVRRCDAGCGYAEISYNSCRDRHCPKCQALDRVRWQEARAADLLPVPYFHVVFTVPSELHAVFLAHPRRAYGLLFKTVAATLSKVARDPERLGARIGLTAVLHTWTQTLRFHPHLHCIVPGGGPSEDGRRWVAAREDFFLPVRVLSAVFRGKLLAAFERAVDAGDFDRRLGRGDTKALLRQAAATDWVVYAKRPFAGPEQVVAYLGRYTHRIAIGNERILAMEGDQVTFAYRDRADGNSRKSMTLPATAFLRRFLLHVLPPGFVRIRHYGLLANAVRRERVAQCRRLLGVTDPPAEPDPEEDWAALLLRLTGEDVLRCPSCGVGRLHLVGDVPPSACEQPSVDPRAASP
jgi:hypothetical protein